MTRSQKLTLLVFSEFNWGMLAGACIVLDGIIFSENGFSPRFFMGLCEVISSAMLAYWVSKCRTEWTRNSMFWGYSGTYAHIQAGLDRLSAEGFKPGAPP